MAEEGNLIQYAVEDGIARIVLADAARLNALSIDLQRELLAALDKVRADVSVRAVLMSAAGKAFCVGADLGSLGTAAPGETVGGQTERMMRELTNPIVQQIHELPVPVVCAVQGAVAGAGVGLALAADVVVAARSAYFYLPFMPKLGLVPDAGSTWFMTRLLGKARATALALLGDRLGAEQAEAWGLIAACVADDQLADKALDMARRLAALPALGVQEIRHAFDAAQNNDLAAQLDHEARRQHELIDRDTFQEGVKAFFEKRPPRFPGR